MCGPALGQLSAVGSAGLGAEKEKEKRRGRERGKKNNKKTHNHERKAAEAKRSTEWGSQPGGTPRAESRGSRLPRFWGLSVALGGVFFFFFFSFSSLLGFFPSPFFFFSGGKILFIKDHVPPLAAGWTWNQSSLSAAITTLGLCQSSLQQYLAYKI